MFFNLAAIVCGKIIPHLYIVLRFIRAIVKLIAAVTIMDGVKAGLTHLCCYPLEFGVPANNQQYWHSL